MGSKRDDFKLPPLRPRRDSARFAIPWSLVRAKAGESCRWECIDGRWVSLALGQGPELGKVVVTDSAGGRSLAESFEEALETAKRMRT